MKLAKQCENKERNRVFQQQQNKDCNHCHNDDPPSIEPAFIKTSHQMPQVAADRGIIVKVHCHHYYYAHIVLYASLYVSVYVHMCMYMCVCMSVCMYACM